METVKQSRVYSEIERKALYNIIVDESLSMMKKYSLTPDDIKTGCRGELVKSVSKRLKEKAIREFLPSYIDRVVGEVKPKLADIIKKQTGFIRAPESSRTHTYPTGAIRALKRWVDVCLSKRTKEGWINLGKENLVEILIPETLTRHFPDEANRVRFTKEFVYDFFVAELVARGYTLGDGSKSYPAPVETETQPPVQPPVQAPAEAKTPSTVVADTATINPNDIITIQDKEDLIGAVRACVKLDVVAKQRLLKIILCL